MYESMVAELTSGIEKPQEVLQTWAGRGTWRKPSPACIAQQQQGGEPISSSSSPARVSLENCQWTVVPAGNCTRRVCRFGVLDMKLHLHSLLPSLPLLYLGSFRRVNAFKVIPAVLYILHVTLVMYS